MLRNVSELHGHTVEALDGEIGSVDEVYFDDEAWGVRYLVMSTGGWLSKRKILISPYAVKRVYERASTIGVTLTREQVRNSPNIDTHQPVSRRHEAEYLGYYDYPPYWGAGNLWGVSSYPQVGLLPPVRITPEERERVDRQTEVQAEDSHLRSTDGVHGYLVATTDDSLGHIKDFIFR